MCKYKSAIIKYDPATDSISIHHYPDVNSHAEIMDRAGIPDDIDDQRDYVARVEKIALDKMTLIDERVRPTWLTDGLMAIIDGEMYRIMMADYRYTDMLTGNILLSSANPARHAKKYRD